MDTGRNDPCPCGSKKKFKRCCIAKKPRNIALTLDLGEPRPVDLVTYSPAGELKLFYQGQEVRPVSARLERSYERPKGPKLLNYAQVACDALTVSESDLFQRYDRIYAMDTNTRQIGSARVSVSAIHMATVEPFNYSISLAKVGLVSLLEFRDVNGKPENVAWRRAIEFIQGSPSIAAHFRLGIIVDSDLGALPAYNDRALPIEGDFYLPERYTLIYASADIGRDQISNKLIALCDKESRRLLDYLAAVPDDDEGLDSVENRPYSYFRLWFPREDQAVG